MMDKSSVLEHMIRHMIHIQKRVKMLEDQAASQTMVVKEIPNSGPDDENKDEDEHEPEDEESSSSTSYGQPVPEIEARVFDKSVLLKIRCEKRKGVLVKILSEIEKLNLAVVNISVTRFGSLAHDITITAKMEKEISVAAKEIVKTLCSALLHAC